MQDKRSSAGSRQRQGQAESNYYSEEIPGPVLDPVPVPVPTLASGHLRQDVESRYDGYEIQYHHYDYPADVDPSIIPEDAREYENNERDEEQPIYDNSEDERPTSDNYQQEQPMYDYVDGSERNSHGTGSYVEVVGGLPYDSNMTVS